MAAVCVFCSSSARIDQAYVDLAAAVGTELARRDMRSRKGAMDERCDAFLTLPGGLGTLEELLEIWVSRTLAMHVKPVVVLDPDGVYDPRVTGRAPRVRALNQPHHLGRLREPDDWIEPDPA